MQGDKFQQLESLFERQIASCKLAMGHKIQALKPEFDKLHERYKNNKTATINCMAQFSNNKEMFKLIDEKI